MFKVFLECDAHIKGKVKYWLHFFKNCKFALVSIGEKQGLFKLRIYPDGKFRFHYYYGDKLLCKSDKIDCSIKHTL